MCRHYGRIVFVLISGSGECLQRSRRGTKLGVGEMRHRGVVNGWQKTASSKSNQKKNNWFCLRVCAYVWMCGFYRFIAVALLCLSFQFYFNFSTARSPEPRCACLAGWLAGSVAFCRHFYFQLGSNKCARALATLAPQSVAATSLAHQPNNEKDKQSAIMPKFVFIFVALANTHMHTHKQSHAQTHTHIDRCRYR